MLSSLLGSLLVAVLAGTSVGTPSPAKAAAKARPNVVVIVMDDMRRDDLPWMPSVVERIAARGTYYTRYYTPLALCCPARAALLRGQYPHNTGVLTNAQPDGGFAAFTRLDRSTLATWLDPFYETGYVGKYFNGYEGPRQRYVPPGWDDWMGTIETYAYLGTVTNDNGVAVSNRGRNSPTVFGQQASRFITDRAGPRARRPFFLHLSFVTPHNGGPHNDGDGGPQQGTPYVPPRDRGTYDGPAHVRHSGYNEEYVRDKTGPVANLPRLSRADKRHVRLENQQRRESLASADRAVDRVLTALRRTDQLDDTYVVFTSDNGYLLGEHRYPYAKRLPYQESSRLPLLIRGPGVPVRRWGGLVTTPDLARTVLEMAELAPRRVQPGHRLDGRSVLPERSRLASARRRAVLLEGARVPTDPENGGGVRYAAPRPVADTSFAYRGVVTKRWKLVQWYPSDRSRRGFELYDLRADPHEAKSLYGEPGTERKVRQLQRRLDRLWMCAGRQCRR